MKRSTLETRRARGRGRALPAAGNPLHDEILSLQQGAGNGAVASYLQAQQASRHEGPLPSEVRDDMEGAFGQSFADVQIHQDSVAPERGALAVTAGKDIHFAPGRFAPETAEGRFLLGHELAHVVQQSEPSVNAGAGGVPGRLADGHLDDAADRAGSLAARGDRVPAAMLGRVAATLGRVSQHFDEEEHKKIGDLATAGPSGEVRTVELAPDYRVTYGEMVAMAADHFTDIEEMRALAADPGKGEGTREELEYVRVVKVDDNDKAKASFSDGARTAADRRFNRLASRNPSHFPAPTTGDNERPIADRARDTTVSGARIQSLFPFRAELVQAPANAIAGYHMTHGKALVEAATAGGAGATIDTAMATEAFSNHYLTDCFSGGHARTERTSATEYWDAQVPMFAYNLQGYLAQKIAEHLSTAVTSPYGVDAFYAGGVPFVWDGTFDTLGSQLADAGVPLTFGSIVAGSIHDYDGKRGVHARVGDEDVRLYGDSHLGEGDEQRLAVAAVQASVDELQNAYRLGAAGVDPDSLPGAIGGPTTDGLFAAERLLPTAVPDAELAVSQPDDISVPWEFPSYVELLKSSTFQAAVAVFAEKKAGKLDGLVAKQRSEVQDAVKLITARLRTASDAWQVLREIIEWVPDTGGGLFGHNQDDNAMDYIEEATKTSGGLESLAVPARAKLITFLFDGKTWEDEEDAAWAVLTANPHHIYAVADIVGWDEIEDELGEDRMIRAMKMGGGTIPATF